VSLCVLALAALVWSVHKFRLQQLRARFQAVLNERNRLAREMHDTLIQGCVSVSALLEAHLSLGHADGDAKQDLMSCARSQLRATIDEARDAVGNLRHTPLPVASLTPLLRKMTEELGQEFGVPVECCISGKPFEFQQATVHELLMVVREAIYNAVRHGRPNWVKLDINFRKNNCSVRIIDDGTGFEPGDLSSLPLGHYGLVGMQERVERIGGKLVLSSHSGSGTEVKFQVPRRATAPSDEDEKEIHVGL
jgi:signal transduction histidine kinase